MRDTLVPHGEVRVLACCWQCSFLACSWLCSFHPLWVRSFVFLSLGSFYLPSRPRSLSLLTPRRCCCGLSITPCVTFSCTALSFACCAWSGGLTSTTVLSLRALRVNVCDLGADLLWFASTSFLALANGLSMTSIVLRVYCFGLRAHVPPKLLEFCSHNAASGHVPHGQWALLGTDTLVLIDRSACLVEPRTRDRRIKCVPHGPLTVSCVSLIVGLCAASSWHRPLTRSERSWPGPG